MAPGREDRVKRITRIAAPILTLAQEAARRRPVRAGLERLRSPWRPKARAARVRKRLRAQEGCIRRRSGAFL
jgi:hypothetical protein